MTESLTNRTQENPPVGAVLVVGGGIGGMAASLDLAESGFRVYLVEKEPSIGGTMAQLDKTFPTNDCAMCTLAPRLVDAGKHLNIEKLTYSEVLGVEGEAGRFKARVLKKARSVDTAKCTGCGSCTEHCVVHNRPYAVGMEPTVREVRVDDVERVHGILRHYRDQTAIVPILQDITREFRWLPEWSLRLVSARLEMPLGRVLRIATFYNLFSLTPRGKHVIRVCTGTACHVKGAFRLVESLERDLGIKAGGTTTDNRFSLEAVRCLGCCGLAPVVTINDEVYGKISAARLVKELDQYPV